MRRIRLILQESKYVNAMSEAKKQMMVDLAKRLQVLEVDARPSPFPNATDIMVGSNHYLFTTRYDGHDLLRAKAQKDLNHYDPTMNEKPVTVIYIDPSWLDKEGDTYRFNQQAVTSIGFMIVMNQGKG